MLKTWGNVNVIVKDCAKVKPNDRVLIVADDHGSSIKMGQQLAEKCTSEGAEVVMTIMLPREYNGQEPPGSVAAAMLECDIVFVVAFGGPPIVHTSAAKSSREKGIRQVIIRAPNEAIVDKELSLEELTEIKELTERVADILSRSDSVRITSSLGTDLRLSIKNRKGLALHPLSGAAVIVYGNWGEAAISPVEDSTEGTLVSDGGFLGWDLLPTEPVRLLIKHGRVIEVSGHKDYVNRVKELLATDENASNCAAELGIGTSRIAERRSRGGFGTIHIGCGRNNDIGGQTLSQIHDDLLVYRPTLWLDNLCLIKDGEFKVPQT